MRFFTSDFFVMNRSDSTAKNMPKIVEVKLSHCGLKKKLPLRSCHCGATFLYKVAEFRLRKCFFQLAELRLRTQKKLPCAYLCLDFMNHIQWDTAIPSLQSMSLFDKTIKTGLVSLLFNWQHMVSFFRTNRQALYRAQRRFCRSCWSWDRRAGNLLRYATQWQLASLVL